MSCWPLHQQAISDPACVFSTGRRSRVPASRGLPAPAGLRRPRAGTPNAPRGDYDGLAPPPAGTSSFPKALRTRTLSPFALYRARPAPARGLDRAGVGSAHDGARKNPPTDGPKLPTPVSHKPNTTPCGRRGSNRMEMGTRLVRPSSCRKSYIEPLDEIAVCIVPQQTWVDKRNVRSALRRPTL
jgi:hypothetical protein